MLNTAIVFALIAFVAAVLGFGLVAGTAASTAKILFLVFLVLTFASILRSKKF